MKSKEKEMSELQNSSEFSQNFYVEDLEDRFEMTAAAPPGGMIPNDVCWTLVIRF